MATNMALITIHTPADRRGRSLGAVSAAVAAGAMLGPIAGGFIAERLPWEWLFLIHVPLILAASLLAIRYIPARGQAQKSGKPDIAGLVLFAGGTAVAVAGVSNVHAWGFMSVKSLLAFFAAAGSFAFFGLWERRCPKPFLAMASFRSPALSHGLIISCGTFAVANIALVVMPFYLTRVAALSPLWSGYVLIAYPVCMALSGPLAGALSDRYGSLPLIGSGLSCMGAAYLGLILFPEQLPIAAILLILAFLGFGMGMIASPVNNYIFAHVPAGFIGSFGGLIALTRNVGLVLGAAIGLGFLNESAGETLRSYQTVFTIGLGICLALVFVFVSLGYRAARDGRA
ncbi:MFS transporter [Paenibacillus macerans]|uniref:MFS transporter n=1 Tax=Paenibacillus TaxID=44249 RepID=UPI002DBB86EF|nr:MFS transporter [Paenibacillus macerans]MEC0135587.1 MFS transporter [Paenibacillus macerans]